MRLLKAVYLVSFMFLVGMPMTSMAGPCDAYFPFDGLLADRSGNGHHGSMFGTDQRTARASYTEGKYGQALELDGTGAMRAPLDLHWDSCPKVTISAWIKVASGASNVSPVLFSTGQGSGPGMYFSPDYLKLNGTENGIHQPNAIRTESWMFVAGVYDYEAGVYVLYWSGRSSPPGILSRNRTEPENSFWIGTENDHWGYFVSGVAIDELRITGRALDAQEVMALRESPSETSLADSGATESNPPACSAQEDCGTDSYCAMDGACYPNSQLPVGYTASASTGSAGRPPLDVTNPNPTPGGSLNPDLGGDQSASGSGGSSSRTDVRNPNTQPGDDLIPDVGAGRVMEGRWVYFVDVTPGQEGGIVRHTTLDFFGPDNGLSGTVSRSRMFPGLDEEPLTNITKLGRTITFSSENFGSRSGEVTASGHTLYIQSLNPSLDRMEFLKVTDTVASETEPMADPEPAPAPADEPTNAHVRPGPTGARQFSAVSGVLSGTVNKYSVDLVNGFIRRIVWAEDSDRPCQIEIHGWQPSTVPAGYETASQTMRFGTSCSQLANQYTEDRQDISLDRTIAAIGRIQVCNNINNNMRMKGLRIWGDMILDDGDTTYISREFEARLPNCQQWASDVLCPSDTWATGVRVHTREDSRGREAITALELICRSIIAPGRVE